MAGKQRNKLKFTKADRQLVDRMIEAEATQPQIAKALGCSVGTLRRRFREELSKKAPGVPARQFEEAERNLVSAMVSFGIIQAEIAKVLEIDVSTLRRAFVEELATGQTKANAQVASALYTNATSGQSVRAQIFWLRSRAGWTDAGDEAPPAPAEESLRTTISALDSEGRAALRTVLQKMGARSALTPEGPKPGDRLQ